jgi:hypothetical protein
MVSRLMTVLQCVPFEKILNPMLHPEVTCIDMRIIMLTPPILVCIDSQHCSITVRRLYILRKY